MALNDLYVNETCQAPADCTSSTDPKYAEHEKRRMDESRNKAYHSRYGQRILARRQEKKASRLYVFGQPRVLQDDDTFTLWFGMRACLYINIVITLREH